MFINSLNLLSLLHSLQKSPLKDHPSLYESLFGDYEGIFGLFTTFIRLIGNLVHLNKKAQGIVLEGNFLYMVISFTGLDEKNPLIREWSIVLIRYLTEGSF